MGLFDNKPSVNIACDFTFKPMILKTLYVTYEPGSK